MPARKTPIRILLVEDHRLFLELLHGLCERQFGFKVVGAVETGEETIRLAAKTSPDVILLDINLPDLDGIDVAKTLLAENVGHRIVALSSQIDDYTLHRVMESGIQGYVDKNQQTSDVLKTAIEAVAAGGIYFTPAVQDARRKLRQDSDAFSKILTEREQQLLALLGSGLSSKEIGAKLGIEAWTVYSHRRNIMIKLNLAGPKDLIRYALDHGFVRQKTRRD